MLLDEAPSSDEAGPESAWFETIRESLSLHSADWIRAIDRIEGLSDEHAWALLGWCERSATSVVRTKSSDLLETSILALALVLRSDIDRRDCMIVAALLHRAADLVGQDFGECVKEASLQLGASSVQIEESLTSAPADTPATHNESGSGSSFKFVRKSPTFDVVDLERWLDDQA